MKNQDALVKRAVQAMRTYRLTGLDLWTWEGLARAAIKAMPKNRDTERLDWILAMTLGVSTRRSIDREIREWRRK